MNDMKALEHLAPIADEMLAGLHADERMRLRVKNAAMAGRKTRRRIYTAIPAACCAAAVLALAVVIPGRLAPKAALQEGVVPIASIAAGGEQMTIGETIADLSGGAQVRASSRGGQSLFAEAAGDIPMVAVGGAVYRLLETPGDMGGALMGGEIAAVALHTDEPSLLSDEEFAAGASNVAQQGAVVYEVDGIDPNTAVAAEVDGSMRLFQRVSYAGRGPGGLGLEDVFDVRGRVRSVEMTGRGEITGSAANEVIGVLLDRAILISADETARREYLTVTLESGLKLQMGVSGDMLCGCGGWSCPEFFEAFDAAL